MPAKNDKQKVTMSIPTDLIKIADLQAELMGLDRYDVIRVALAQGLAVLRMQHELATNPEHYKDEIKAFIAGDPSAEDKLGEKLSAGVEKSVRHQVGESPS